MITSRLKHIDSFFDVVADHLSFSSINPKNSSKARAAFFKNGRNPFFRYERASPSLAGFRDILLELRFGDSPLERLFERKRKELILKAEVLLSIGTQDFSRKVKRLYPPPNKRLVEQAYLLLGLPRSQGGKRILRKEAVLLFRRAFQEMGLKYRIRSVEMTASAQVNAERRALDLRKRERFAQDYVKRLVVHEIGTHALRTENGFLQPLKLFKNGFAHYLDTEEGLAAFNEFRAGLMTHSILRNYAGRVVAVHYALTHDFADTFAHLKRYFSEKMSWKLALRAKRGLHDTSRPGAYTKDCAYLRGFLEVWRFSRRHDVESLYVGKIGIRDLPLLAEVPHLSRPKFSLGDLLSKGLVEPSERCVTEEDLVRALTPAKG